MGISISAVTDLQLYFMVHWFKFLQMLILSNNQQSKIKDSVYYDEWQRKVLHLYMKLEPAKTNWNFPRSHKTII